MFIPKGCTEEQVTEDIIYVVGKLSKHFRFGYHEIEDMKQEGFVFALECLPYYDPKCASLRTFLYTHVRNQFINMKRDKYFNKQPPCYSCIFYDAKNKFGNNNCAEFNNKKECQRYQKWISLNESKKSLVQPSNYELFYNHDNYGIVPDNILEDLYTKEIFQIIDDNLPISLRHDYCRLRQGVRLSEYKKDIVIQAIKKILAEKDILEDE